MPDVTDDDFDALPEQNESMDFGSTTTQQHTVAASYTSDVGLGFFGGLGATVGLTATDLIDTAASSIPGIRTVLGAERGEFNQAVLGAIGSPGLSDFYTRNQGAIEVASGVAGIIASSIVAGGILRSGGAAMNAIRGVPFVGRIATLDKEYNNAIRLAQLTNKALAARGAMGVEQFAGSVMLGRLGMSGLELTAKQAANNVRLAALKRGAVFNVTTEAVMGVTLNQNDFLYFEDAGENIAWMAAGLGIGAGIDLWRSRYALARIANSDVSNRAFQGAYDPTGKEADRLRAALMADRAVGEEATQSWLGYGRGVITDRVTSMMINARELGNKVSDTTFGRILSKNRQSVATPQLEMAYEETNKITAKGIPGIPGTAFTYTSPGYGRGLMDGLYHEPAMLYGVEKIGGANKELGVIGTHQTHLDNLNRRMDGVLETLQNDGKWVRTKRKNKEVGEYFHDELVPLSDEARLALQAEYKELVFHNSLSAHVMLEPGEWLPIQMGKTVENYKPGKIAFEKIGEEKGLAGIWGRQGEEGQGTLGIGHDGQLYLPPGKTDPSRLDFYDALDLYSIADKMAVDMIAAGQRLELPQKPNWFQLDMAENMVRKSKDPNSVVWPAGLTRETAQVESLAQKIDAIRLKEGANKVSQKRGGMPLDDADAFKLRIQFNMPRLTSYQAGLMGDAEHPLEILLNGAKSGDDIRALQYHEVKAGLQEAAKIKGFTDATPAGADELTGNSFAFMKDRDGNPVEAILGYKRPFAPHEWAQDNLAERLAVGKMMVREKLTAAEAGILTRTLATSVLSDPNYRLASEVQGLQDSQIRSALPGFSNAAPQTTRGGFLNSLIQKEFRDRDNPVLLAASRIRELQDRLVRDVMRQTIEREMGDVIGRVNGPRSGASKVLLNQFFTHRTGWDLVKEPIPVAGPNGKQMFSFALDHTSVGNQKRFKAMFDRDLQEGQTLVSPKGTEMVLDELAMEAAMRFQRVSENIRAEKNSLLRAQGLPEIKEAPWYTPPPNTRGKYIGFTFDESDNLVPGGTVIANTQEEFSRLEAAMRDSPIMKPGFTFRTREKVTNFMDLWDKAQMDWLAPGTTAIQPGKKALGMTAGQEMNPNAWDDAMTWMRDSYLQHGSDIMTTLFKDQLNATKARSAVAGLESRVGVGKQDVRGRSIYDFYAENVTGRSSLSAPDSFFGEGMNWVEKRLNSTLREAVPHMSKTYEKLRDFLGAARPGHDTASREQFQRLSQELGPYMPYNNAAEMIARQTGAARPPELAELSGKLSWFEAASRLRWFESMHAVVNLAGIVNAMPAVIRSMQRLPGEADEVYFKRIGHVGHELDLPNGGKIGLIDTTKIAYRSMKRAWSRQAHPYFDYMANRGLLGQEVAEFHKQFGQIKSRGQLMGFLLGDVNADVSRIGGKVAKSGGIDHWIGIISDKSEDFSRSWGMMAGLEVAETIGIRGMEKQVAFAHDMTNKMIANYDPRNRPEIFQGALGAPIGLFQSYIFNYYQRMFRYIETGNNRALATQMATQGAIFGMATVPGWNAVNNLFFDHGGEESDMVEGVNNRFGDGVGDLMLGGVLSNLPKLLGADGVNLYTRGDTEIRSPVKFEKGFVPEIPVADTIKRVWTGVAEGISLFSSDNPNVTGQQLAEITSNMLTNRPIAGFIETFGAGGFDTDGYGQVVAESKSMAEKVYRVLGVRSMQQQKSIDAFYSNKNAMEEQNARKSTLREATRASIRSGDFDALPQLFEKHVELGGDPRYYTRWVKDAYEAALASRSERQLDDVLKNPDKMEYISRLLDANVGIQQGEEETEDYGARAMAESQMNTDIDLMPELPPELQNPGMAAEGNAMLEGDSLFQNGF